MKYCTKCDYITESDFAVYCPDCNTRLEELDESLSPGEFRKLISQFTFAKLADGYAIIALKDKKATKAVIPYGVKSIRGSAFSECFELCEVILPKGLDRIGDKAFYRCTSLASIDIPHGVTAIGEEAFWGCGALKSLTVPATIEKVGKNAFGWCFAIESVAFGGIKKKWDRLHLIGNTIKPYTLTILGGTLSKDDVADEIESVV